MPKKSDKPITSIALFEGKTVRYICHEDRWCFAVTDVIGVLTGNKRPRKYWNDLKTKLTREGDVEVSDFFGHLRMEASVGKSYLPGVVDTCPRCCLASVSVRSSLNCLSRATTRT